MGLRYHLYSLFLIRFELHSQTALLILRFLPKNSCIFLKKYYNTTSCNLKSGGWSGGKSERRVRLQGESSDDPPGIGGSTIRERTCRLTPAPRRPRAAVRLQSQSTQWCDCDDERWARREPGVRRGHWLWEITTIRRPMGVPADFSSLTQFDSIGKGVSHCYLAWARLISGQKRGSQRGSPSSRFTRNTKPR